jgi:hypothetical protein
MRFFANRPDLVAWVRWYPAADGAEWFTGPTPFRSSSWKDALAPDLPLGEIRSSCRQFVSCCFCPPALGPAAYRGTAEQFRDGWDVQQLVGVVPDAHPSGCPCRRPAELTDRKAAEADYGWWQLFCNPTTGLWSRAPAWSNRHPIDRDSAAERSGRVGLPVPGEAVLVVENLGGVERPSWTFEGTAHPQVVRLAEATPTAELADATPAYHAYLQQPWTAGPPGSQEIQGTWFDATPVLVVPSCRAPDIADVTCLLLGTLLGTVGGVCVYVAGVETLNLLRGCGCGSGSARVLPEGALLGCGCGSATAEATAEADYDVDGCGCSAGSFKFTEGELADVVGCGCSMASFTSSSAEAAVGCGCSTASFTARPLYLALGCGCSTASFRAGPLYLAVGCGCSTASFTASGSGAGPPSCTGILLTGSPVLRIYSGTTLYAGPYTGSLLGGGTGCVWAGTGPIIGFSFSLSCVSGNWSMRVHSPTAGNHDYSPPDSGTNSPLSLTWPAIIGIFAPDPNPYIMKVTQT